MPPLEALVGAGHDVALCVSRADTRRGRGGGQQPSPVKAAAEALGIPVTDRLDDALDAGAELGVVVAYGRIVPVGVLGRLAFVNLHFSLLPRWRGAAPVERAILAGDRDTGVCLMRLEEGLDTGPVLARRTVPMDAEHAGVLTGRLSRVGAELLVELLAGGPNALGPGEPQAGEPTYAAKIEAAELRLDWSRPGEHLQRVVRLDRAWTTFRGGRLRILEARPHQGGSSGPPGVMDGTSVSTGRGVLELVTVQPEGRRPMPADAWRRGVRPEPGERLGAGELPGADEGAR